MHTLATLASMQPFKGAYVQSDFPGKMIIWALIFLSVICWITLIYKIWQARKVKQASERVFALIEKHKEHLLQLDEKFFSPFMQQNLPHPFPSIYFALKDKTTEILHKKIFFLEKTGLSPEVYLTPSDMDVLEQCAASSLSHEYKILEKNLFILSTVYTLAPFLGLLGTVWGILVTFSSLQGGAAVSSNAAILGGISTALSTTVMGLVIAIPALIAYNYLKSSLQHFSADMEHFFYHLLSIVELQYRKVDLT